MNRTFKPSEKLDAANSVLTGIRINKNGKVAQIRVRVLHNNQTPEIVKSRELLNRLSDHLETAGL